MLAQYIDKGPLLVELILSKSNVIARKRPGVVIVEHRLGYVHANARIDKANIASGEENPRVLLLPFDSDSSAASLSAAILKTVGVNVSIIIKGSAERAWRNGTIGIAIGCVGFEPLEKLIGTEDLIGRSLEVTEVAVADELAAAVSFVMGQANEGVPVVHVRGARLRPDDGDSGSLISKKRKYLFR